VIHTRIHSRLGNVLYIFLLFLLLVSSLNTLAEETILVWNTFIGSVSDDDIGRGIVVDAFGNVYVTGTSEESWGTPINAHSGGSSLPNDIFVAKFDNNGVLQWNTFMGASSSDYGNAIAIDSLGNVYVTGESWSSWGAPLNPHVGGPDIFVAKLNSNGILQWNTYMGSGFGEGNAITLDDSTNIYVTGRSAQTWGAPVNGIGEAFVAKLDNSGALQWHTFMGAPDDFILSYGIAVDGAHNVYVTGNCNESWGSPVNAFTGISRDVFVVKLNSEGELQWNTFMGASDNGADDSNGLAVDGLGNVYVVGASQSSWGTPINAYTGIWEAFVAKLDNNGVRQWHTFMGAADGREYGQGIILDNLGSIYVTGYSNDWGTPDNAHAGYLDAFVAKLDNNGVQQWNTFMGASDAYDYAYGVVLDGLDNIYVVGKSEAPWGTPINSHTGGEDAFIVKISTQTLSPPILTSPSDNATNISTMPTLTVNVTSDPDKHDKTEWQISDSSDFSSIIFKSISFQHIESIKIPHLALIHGTKYYWRARIYEENMDSSDWSNIFAFTTSIDTNDTNANGIPDDLEDETIDVDGDNIPDSTQDDIKSFNTVVGDSEIGISIRNEPSVTSTESIDSINPVSISNLSRPFQAPLGLFAVRLLVLNPGEEVEVIVHFSEAAADNMVWYYYNTVNGWSDYSDYATYSQDRMSIVLKLKDGGHGDADGIENGIIVDPGGSGIASFMRGLVYDDASNQGIKRAEIRIEELKILSFDDGHYLTMLLPGEYLVSVVAEGFQSITETIKVPEAFALEKNFGLTPGSSEAPLDDTNGGGGGGGGGCFIKALL